MKEKLLISVNGGKNLKKKKTWILLKLKLHDAKYKTKYVYGGENVVFQKETFIFEVNEDVYPAGDLEIKVKTWEMLKKGEVFAFATVPLAPITSEIRSIGSSEFTEIKSYSISASLSDSTSSVSSTASSSTTTTTLSASALANSNSNSSSHIVTNNSIQKRIALKSKKGDETNSDLTISFELVPESESSTTMKSIPLLFRWFPDLPHSETVISECYCTKEAKKAISMSHNGTMYITQNYLCFRSPSHLAKNKKTMIHFKDITRIKKKIGSFYLPNAIEVRTSKKKYLFASFIHRSKAYTLLINQWNLHGGSERDSGNSTIDEDDDDNEDDDNTPDLEDDEEVTSIMVSPLKSGGGGSSFISNVRSLSPLSKLTDSTGSNSSSSSGSNSIRKPRSQSMGSNSASLTSSSSSKSPNKPGTPTNSITESKSNSSGNLNPNQLKLIIEIEDFEQFGTNNHLMINVSKDNTIQDLLDKLKLKLTVSSDDKFNQNYILAIGKLKKNKKNKRGSGVYLPLDQLMMVNQPLEDDITSYVTLLHRAKSTGGNAMVERKFIILDRHKQLSAYSFESQDIIFLKKPRYIEDVNLCFEIVEDKSKVIKLILNVDIKISEIFKELSKYYNKKFFVADYYLYIPKNGERGMVLDSEMTLADYNVGSNCTIQVMRYPPFDGFTQKFKYSNSRSKRSLLFELIQSCLTLSIPTTQMQLMDRPQEFLDRLQQKLQLDDVDAKMITANVLSINSYKDEGLLVELKSRCEMLMSKYDVDPYYNAESLGGNNESYQIWRRLELNHVVHLMKNIIFKEDCFYGVIFVRLIEAEGLSSLPINQYCIFSTPYHRVKSTTQLNTNEPEWNQSFLLKLKKPKGKLEVAVMSSTASTDTLLGKIEINIKDLEDTKGSPKDMWFSLPTSGRIHLSLEYHYQYSEYNDYLNNIHSTTTGATDGFIDQSQEENEHNQQHSVNKANSTATTTNTFDLSKHIPIDHIALYKILFNFIIEERDRLAKLNQPTSITSSTDTSSTTEASIESNGNIDDSDWLTIPFRSLLNQYCMRFGVCKTSSNIIQFEVMVEKYSIEKNYIFELEEVTNTILDILNGKDEGVFTVSELQSLKQSLDKLIPKVNYNIGRYYESFPSNKPRGCLRSLVKIFENILTLRGIINKNPVTNFSQRLSLCVQEESKRKFEENIAALGFMAMEYDQKVKEVGTITNMLVEVMAIITEEIDQTIHFESAFPQDVKITCDVIDAWGDCIDSTEKDDKKSVSITQGVSSSYILFFEACDAAIKDFSSLAWLPDSFSYVQLLEVLTSEVINYCQIISEQFEHYLEHTEVEQHGKPTLFTLNVEPVVMLNNLDAAKTRLDLYGQKIERDLNRHLGSSQAAHLDENSKQCVTNSFKLCMEQSQSIVSEFYNRCIQSLSDRMKQHVFYQFQEVLFSEPLVSLNSHLNVANEDDIESGVVTTQNSNAATVLFEPVHDTSVLLNNAGSAATSTIPTTIKTSINNKENLKYEKAILSVTKDFLSPKIEELYSKLKEPLFKLFIKKLWGELIDDLLYLVVPRPSDLVLSFHSQHLIMADEQISIVNNCLKDLIIMFHKGGAGCPTPTLEERSNPLKHMLIATGMETTPLIDLYNQRKSMVSSKTMSLNTVTKDHIIGILGTRVEFDKEARTFVNKINGVTEKPLDPEVEQIKVVPETEFIIERYHCSLNGQLGVLILSSRYLGFQNLLKEIGVKLGTKLSVPLVNIEEIKKTKIAFLFNAMQVNTKDGKSYTFTGFFDRDSVFRDLSSQMKVAQKNQK
ncbi:hypothetical protein PPL_05407 [Heterostelium album PN500]|uniref:C2 domain-containing protein n=1 Tax=Heterostelium pallidum (strain ATCC 26659 / Pp 5 / PN500) TaxID=670386 RepID=D3BA34_HETP5|nr:hypothetical protein PPL_05407 [Heterostelium album PN500]EFA81421.1 hypothetical protein PPL_05407 [Heterostelium album PN500]|eukprot:XP_020433539.1 hypothetical protein PPL_05407 [Heterostelium album PN500]